ncbi:MAG: hypothetical protein LBI67_05060, partial [Treponema sp.]|nr:hypothetical protein [Treponema sp.]
MAASSCNLFTNSLADYFEDNTGIVNVKAVEITPDIRQMANGTVLVPDIGIGGTTTLTLTLLNPRRLAVSNLAVRAPSGAPFPNITAAQT